MAAPLPKGIRDLMQRDAYLLDIKHYKQADIAEELSKEYGVSVSRETTNKLIGEYRVIVREQMDATTVQEQLSAYVHKNESVEHDAWKRLAQTKANAQNVPGLQSNILTAAKNTATALGILTDRKGVALTDKDGAVVDPIDALRALFDVPYPRNE